MVLRISFSSHVDDFNEMHTHFIVRTYVHEAQRIAQTHVSVTDWLKQSCTKLMHKFILHVTDALGV